MAIQCQHVHVDVVTKRGKRETCVGMKQWNTAKHLKTGVNKLNCQQGKSEAGQSTDFPVGNSALRFAMDNSQIVQAVLGLAVGFEICAEQPLNCPGNPRMGC